MRLHERVIITKPIFSAKFQMDFANIVIEIFLKLAQCLRKTANQNNFIEMIIITGMRVWRWDHMNLKKSFETRSSRRILKMRGEMMSFVVRCKSAQKYTDKLIHSWQSHMRITHVCASCCFQKSTDNHSANSFSFFFLFLLFEIMKIHNNTLIITRK